MTTIDSLQRPSGMGTERPGAAQQVPAPTEGQAKFLLYTLQGRGRLGWAHAGWTAQPTALNCTLGSGPSWGHDLGERSRLRRCMGRAGQMTAHSCRVILQAPAVGVLAAVQGPLHQFFGYHPTCLPTSLPWCQMSASQQYCCSCLPGCDAALAAPLPDRTHPSPEQQVLNRRQKSQQDDPARQLMACQIAK